MKRALLVVLFVMSVTFISVQPAHALTVSGLSITLGCTDFISATAWTYTGTRDNTGTGNESILFTVTDGAGTTLYSEASVVGIGSTTSGGVGTYKYFTNPAYNPLTAKMISLAGNGLSEQIAYSTSGTCAGLPTFEGAYAGPPIPAGFVLRTITCDVAVFDTPAGQPVGSNRIKGGQTWYVNPKSVKGSDGAAWTEIFVSGDINGYIPTKCVGG